MRKVYEIVMVIAAAGLAAAVALIDIPTHSADPGTVIGGEGLVAAPPPVIGPSFPPLPPLLAPPGSSTPVPTDPAATPTSPLRVQPQGVTEAASAAVGVLSTASVPRPPTATTDPPAAKPKAKPATKAKPAKAKPKPPPPKAKPVKAKPKPPPPKAKAKGGTKPEDRRKSASTGSSSRSRPGG